MSEVRIVPDIEEEIVDAVNAMRHKYDYVFTTGGIGPTHDDITSAAIAKAFDVPLVRHPDALALLENHYEDKRDLNAQRLKMADVPQGARLIDNPISKAPGFQIENVYVLAGVPKIMQVMFDGLKDDLTPGPPMLSHTLVAFIGEGVIAGGLGDIQEGFPDVEIGSYPFFRNGKLGSCLVMRSPSADSNAQATEAVRDLVRQHGVEPLDE